MNPSKAMRNRKVFSPEDEKVLLEGLRKGEKRSVRAWYGQFFPYFLRVCLRKVSQPQDAEEIVQQTFINALRQLPLFRQQSQLKTWMMSILNHEVADYYRKRYAKKALQTIPLLEVVLHTPLKSPHEVSEKVEEVLAEMKKEHKELLLLKYVDKKRIKEIAALLGKTIKAVESDLFRARGEFRALYEAKGWLRS